MLRKIVVLMVCLLTLGSSLAAAQDTGKTYILVHGAFQDASGWAHVMSTLEAAGNTALAVELPGRGEDSTPLAELTLERYRDAVVTVIEQQEQPVILVGHSFGGMVISAVSETIPDRIEALVYVAAYLPRDGESLNTIAAQDHYSVLGQEGNLIIAEDFTYASVNESVFASAFCPDCSEEQRNIVAASQLNEPLAPLNEPVALTEANFGSVSKTYILTAQDVVVSPQLQALMLANTPVEHVYALNTGHVPYITAPDALATLLMDVGV